GLWIKAIFAGVFGVTGFVVTIPSILAGTASVAVLYHLVQKGFGKSAGLISAFVLAITPVTIATDRTNNLDSMLILALLLATWAFIRATETAQWRPLLIGAVWIGVAFNIKMLQAYLIVPALYAFYFFGANTTWTRKIIQMMVTTIVLFAVSFSWAFIVQITPVDQRPYIGGSQSNSAFELAFGYNGLQRLLGQDFSGNNTNPVPYDNISTSTPPDQTNIQNFNPSQAINGVMFGGEVGNPSITRLFTAPLANELVWLLPLSLLTIGLLLIRTKIKFPLSKAHQAVMLWGGWLMTGVVFFSISEFFHAYYLATLAPASAALVGIGVVTIWDMRHTHRNLMFGFIIGMSIITLALQIGTANQYGAELGVVTVLIGCLLMVGVSLGIFIMRQTRALPIGAFGLVMSALFIMPSAWGIATATNIAHSMMLPSAYDGGYISQNNMRGLGMTTGYGLPENMNLPNDITASQLPQQMNNNMLGGGSSALIDYLQANAGDETYTIAVPNSQSGAQIVLQTDLGVLFLGGFSGGDPIHTAESIETLVKNGDLRYILTGGMMGIMGGDMGTSNVNTWVVEHCAVVEDIDLTPDISAMLGGMGLPQDMTDLPTPPQGITNLPMPP
ncbi:MAG: glycosyltransferase family 39 protein, partial [Anaerolineae bacterium]|nr:glycosyltransferase family 39 protein [Anaerolineae bacterium]